MTVEAAATGCEPIDLDGDGDLDCSGPVSGNYPWTVDDYNQAIQLVKPSHALAADPEASEFTQEKIVYEMLVRSWEAARDNIADPSSPGPRW